MTRTTLKLAVIALFSSIILIAVPSWALDEAILTPTNDSAKSAEDEAFNSAMSVWYSHRYADGEKQLASSKTWARMSQLVIGYCEFKER